MSCCEVVPHVKSREWVRAWETQLNRRSLSARGEREKERTNPISLPLLALSLHQPSPRACTPENNDILTPADIDPSLHLDLELQRFWDRECGLVVFVLDSCWIREVLKRDLQQGLDTLLGHGLSGQLDGVAVAHNVGGGVDCDGHLGGVADGRWWGGVCGAAVDPGESALGVQG